MLKHNQLGGNLETRNRRTYLGLLLVPFAEPSSAQELEVMRILDKSINHRFVDRQIRERLLKDLLEQNLCQIPVGYKNQVMIMVAIRTFSTRACSLYMVCIFT